MKITGSHFLTSDGENTTSYCTTRSPLRSTSTRLREITGGTQLPLNQRPDYAQARRECKGLHDEHLARTQQEYRDIPRSQQLRQRKGQQFEGNEELDYAVDPKNRLEVPQTVAGKPADICVKLAGQLASSFVIVVNVGPNPVEDEQLGFSAFFKSCQVVNFFS